MLWVVSDTLDNAQAFRPALSEKYSVTRREELGTLDETECNQCTITSPDEGTVNVNYGAGLTHCSHV